MAEILQAESGRSSWTEYREIRLYAEGKNIIVENATEAITVSDALGRVVSKDDAHIVRTETRKFPVPSSGAYVVKIGNRAASVLVR